MDFFQTVGANPNATQETLEKKRVSWNHGLKGCYSDETRQKMSETLKNHSHRQAINRDPEFRRRQSEIMKNSQAARIARFASRAKAEATKHANGYYDNKQPKVKQSKVKQPKVKQPKVKQPRQLQGAKGGKGLREGVAMGTPLMTPEGLFESRAAYIRHTGLTGATISGRIKNCPEQYFYLD